MRREYDHFLQDGNNSYVDIDNILEIERHAKIYGIIPDTESKTYLERLLTKMKKTDERFKKSFARKEIMKIEQKLKHGHDE